MEIPGSKSGKLLKVLHLLHTKWTILSKGAISFFAPESMLRLVDLHEGKVQIWK